MLANLSDGLFLTLMQFSLYDGCADTQSLNNSITQSLNRSSNNDDNDCDDGDESDDDDEALVGFQRKIVPIDSLNLSLEDSQQQSLRNAAGRKRQELIVCATFVDKIPNLGGLARTSEIFAADKLVIPDKRVVKMDNFKSISVSAGDWIPIEEVKEEVSNDIYNILCWN